MSSGAMLGCCVCNFTVSGRQIYHKPPAGGARLDGVSASPAALPPGSLNPAGGGKFRRIGEKSICSRGLRPRSPARCSNYWDVAITVRSPGSQTPATAGRVHGSPREPLLKRILHDGFDVRQELVAEQLRQERNLPGDVDVGGVNVHLNFKAGAHELDPLTAGLPLGALHEGAEAALNLA